MLELEQAFGGRSLKGPGFDYNRMSIRAWKGGFLMVNLASGGSLRFEVMTAVEPSCSHYR